MSDQKTTTMRTVAESLAGSKPGAIRLLVDALLDVVAEVCERVPLAAPPAQSNGHADDVGPTMTVAAAAQRLGLSVGYLHHLTRAGYVRRWPAGKMVNYEIPAQDVERLASTDRKRWQPIYVAQKAKTVKRAPKVKK